jgi:hypothetical protein
MVIDTLQDNIEDRGGELPWWQAEKGDGSLATHRAQRLREGGRTDGRHQNAVRAAASRLENIRHRIR